MAKPPSAAERSHTHLEQQGSAITEFQRHNVEISQKVTELVKRTT
jgi:hypothetical protein